MVKKKKICVFTAHSPEAGGGSTILRSLIENIPDISFSWYYLAENMVQGYENGYLGKPLMGGNLITDIWHTWRMVADKKVSYIDKLVDQLIEIDCDGYWIISHNEGLRLAIELVRKQNRPVHMTVHDDWAGALSARSFRYRYMAKAAKKLTIVALQMVNSFDVICAGMQSYYMQLSNIKGEICHRYLPKNAITHTNVFNKVNQSEIIAGHIGSIYDKDDFIAFFSAFHELVKSKGMKPILKMWGCHLTIKDIPERLKDSISFYTTLSEEKVIPELSKCNFVYAMYPLNKSLSIFSKTSLPTKLTSYLQAGRPILGHGPADSSLAAVLSNGLGIMWSSLSKEDGFEALNKILLTTISYEQLLDVRKLYFGEENLVTMQKALSK